MLKSKSLPRLNRLPLNAGAWAIALALLSVNVCTLARAEVGQVMPVPMEMSIGEGRLAIGPDFSVGLRGPDDARLKAALVQALRLCEQRTGLTFKRSATADYLQAPNVDDAALVVVCAGSAPVLPTLGEDESYSLVVNARQATLRAPTTTGILRGLATWTQLLESDASGWFVRGVKIEDRPRFPWRGLMIDVCRHWQPMEVIKRNLDGMALVKLNVLHLHLTDDQGFRIESKTHPRLHEQGSDGHFFTQAEIGEIIAYAAARAIRVVPEFDIPGHTTSWVVAYPELASGPGPYVIEHRWGVFDPVLDPTNEKVYAVLADFLGEMAALFPDPYLHIGGDENNGVQWTANSRIQSFIREHGLKDNAGLHALFNQRIHAVLKAHGKRMVGWDEILHPDLPADSVIHSWRGAQGLADATHRGYAAILSNGYYIDLNFSAAEHYRNDPVPTGTTLTAPEQARVLGGEATMWSEWVSPETIDSRIWPRTAAIAERLWSPAAVTDLSDMYRRLAIVSRRLDETGLLHERNREPMLRQLAGDNATTSELKQLATFVDVIEPVKRYERGQQHSDYTQFSPLNSLADCARPESEAARLFAARVEAFLTAGAKSDSAEPLTTQLRTWRDAGLAVEHMLSAQPPHRRNALSVAHGLAEACNLGLTAIEALRVGPRKDVAWRQEQLAALDRCAAAHDAIFLPVIEPMRRLVSAAAISE